jgi:hypothetical protein
MRIANLMAPMLAAVFPILFLYAHNVGEVTASSVMPVLLAVAVAAMLLTLMLWRGFGNDAHASLVVTVWILVFFLYGHFYNAISEIDLGSISLDTHRVLLPIVLAIAILPLLPFLLRRKLGLGFMPYVTAALAVLMTLNLAAIVMPEARRLGQASTVQDPVEGTVPGPSETSRLPDIYYIVPDRYPSRSTLEEYFGYDNAEFMEFLEDSGFYVADESFANYHETFLSLASSLNMEYLDGLSREVGEDNSDHTPANAMIEDHRVWRILKEQHGYKFIQFGSWWGPTEGNPHADVNVNKHPRLLGLVELDNAFYRLLFRTTLLRAFQENLLQQDFFSQGEAEVRRCRDAKLEDHSHPNAEEQCHRALHTFQQLQEMPSVEGPKFVFVHLLLPHEPYVFGPAGEVVEPPPFYYSDPVPLSADKIEVLERRFLDQLAFTNRKLQESIGHILAESPRPPVIILQSDEGPWTSEYLHGDRENWTAETLRIRQRILNAYYLPDDGGAALYPSVSPVNTFRVIFNDYFNAGLPLLEDKAYRSEGSDRPYSFIEVTDQINSEE